MNIDDIKRTNQQDWPTPEELEAQPSPFDTTTTFPYEYKIVIVEQISEDLFEEQLRTYTIPALMNESMIEVPTPSKQEFGRRFRIAQEGEQADIRVMNNQTAEPVLLVSVS
jgi:hypothetical protein